MGQPIAPLVLADLERVRYADVETLLIGWLTAAFTVIGGRYAAEMPDAGQLEAELAEHGIFVQVEAFGGSNRNPAQDVANVDVDVYAPADADGNPDRGSASDHAELIRAALLFRLPGYYSDKATVSAVATMSRPCARPYDDAGSVRRFGASYQVTVKSR